LVVPQAPEPAPPAPAPRAPGAGGSGGSKGSGREAALPETGERITAASPEPEEDEPTVGSSRAEPGRRLGPVVAAAAAVVLVAGVGGYLGLRSVPDDGPVKTAGASATGPAAASAKDSAPATSPAAPSASASSSASPSASPPASPSATPTQPASPTPTEAKPSDPADALPKGWHMYKDKKMGFSVGLPKGWDIHVRETSHRITFRGPGAGPKSYLLIEESPNPGSDPYKDWKKQERTAKYSFGGYKKLSIKRVDYQKSAADWDFTWNADSGPSRVRNRGFITDNGRAYAIYWHTLKSRWKEDLHFFEGFCATFKPRK
ncbi:hypothetical protein AB0H81_44305, partial [Nonomuraea sp. NPDC050691]